MHNDEKDQAPNVLDMIRECAAETGVTEADIFKRDEVKVTPEPKPVTEQKTTEKEDDGERNDLWGLPREPEDTASYPIYDASQVKMTEEKRPLENLPDVQAKEAAADQMNELQRTHRNLELAKEKLGIKHLNVPGFYTARVFDCASGYNSSRAVEETVRFLTELIEMFPSMVVEWLPGYGPNGKTEEQPEVSEEGADAEPRSMSEDRPNGSADTVSLIIDKSNVTELAFSTDELDRIKNARSVEITIVENRDLKYNVIDEPINNIDTVLSQYTRKFNDRVISLPASRYRCTVTGLSYAEALDLDYSLQLDTLDAEVKKWSIAYDHVRNPSIGPFDDFNDFLRKTSNRDINYLLWAILCSTSMQKEIVSVDCKFNNCNTTHEWVYSPESLLQLDQVPAFLLDEMKVTGEVSSRDEIMDNYNGSMLRLGNVIELPSSKFAVGFGHVSAYAYLNDGIYSTIREAAIAEPLVMSTLIEAEIMESIKFFLLPATDGSDRYYRVTEQKQLMKIVHELDEMDFQVLGQISSMMGDPYKFTFKIKDIVCPKCHHRSDITIPDITKLLFIIAQGLESAKVVLKK